ncbi:hypothetical protein GCT19_39870 [Paraburkholderia sp. CNPSo 3155]|nr:hypothetical protein [Paraburkholderia atlantica]NUY35938.1 hypothetical protein [Paraburkholderia atlantica]
MCLLFVIGKAANTVDFLLRAHRYRVAVRRCFENAIARKGAPETAAVNRGGSRSGCAQSAQRRAPHTDQCPSEQGPDKIIEQDHRAIRRIVALMIRSRISGACASSAPASTTCT